MKTRIPLVALVSLGAVTAGCGESVINISTSSSSSGAGGNGGSSATSATTTASTTSTSTSGTGGAGGAGGAPGTGGTGGAGGVGGTGGMGGGMSTSSSSSSSSTTSTTSSSSSTTTSSSSSSTSSSSTSSSSSTTSSSSGGPVCSPADPLDGAPVMAPANQWTWVPVPEAKCRNGSSTGFGVRINPNSTKLFIYLEGGGACFNAISCVGNPSSFGTTNFNSWKSGGGQTGIFDTTKMDNPLRDWNAVYIPYCTGDVHGGSATGVDVPANGPQNQSFVGYANVGHALRRIIPTFPGVTDVLLTGVSAGGFGAMYNYDRVARDFCPTPVTLIDDSGPPMSDTYLAPCLQTRWRTLWGLNKTLPPDCPEAVGPDGGNIVAAVTCLGTKYGSGRLGLISSDKDSTISQFYGFGQNNCANIDGFAQSLPGATYAVGLNELRTTYLTSPAWATYFVSSTTHTYLGGSNGFYNTTVMGTKLTTWVGNLVNGGPLLDIGP